MRPRLQAPAASEITHTRFLDSAERLFCVHGYEGTKIRAIAKLSSANLGVLSHYWGSKRALFREVFERRLRPVYEEHMRRFGILKGDDRRRPPVRVTDVLEAQIEPAFLVSASGPDDAAQRRRFSAARSPILPTKSSRSWTRSSTSPPLFFALLRHVSPNVDHSEFYWRAHLRRRRVLVRRVLHRPAHAVHRRRPEPDRLGGRVGLRGAVPGRRHARTGGLEPGPGRTRRPAARRKKTR